MWKRVGHSETNQKVLEGRVLSKRPEVFMICGWQVYIPFEEELEQNTKEIILK
jgi:hypothetical protein